MSLDQILCFKRRGKVARDNTVKHNWRTLQLLPGKERPSYAGAQLEVHERLDGQLLVQYQGRTIPTQEAPPCPGVLRASNSPLRYGPGRSSLRPPNVSDYPPARSTLPPPLTPAQPDTPLGGTKPLPLGLRTSLSGIDSHAWLRTTGDIAKFHLGRYHSIGFSVSKTRL